MPLATGCPLLDSMLGCGVPEHRTVLVSGGPGTGKTTLGIQFLQTGLDVKDNCVFITTEQTIDELHDAFDSFAFTLDHDRLTVTSIHATPGTTLESDEVVLTLQTLEPGEELPGEQFGIPFTSRYIRDHLSEFAPVDRVVFDSVSGLRVMAADEGGFRRTILDLIRCFNDTLERQRCSSPRSQLPWSRPQTLGQPSTHSITTLMV